MARNQPKLDAETSNTLEAMRKEEPIEIKETVEAPVDEAKAEPEVKVEPKEEKTVPLAALHETREELKAERKRNEEAQRKTDERIRLLTEAMTRPAEQPKEQVIPDADKNPLDALKVSQQQLKELAEWKRNQEMEQQTNYQRQQLMNEAARLESEFVKATPDYVAASQFLSDSRRGELLASGMYHPNQVNQILKQEAMALAQQAIASGRNPAELVYAISKARGYALKAVEPIKTDNEADKIARIAEGQAANKSIGQAQGAQTSSGAKLDSKTLANMSDEEFQKLYNKMSRGERAALMGG